MELMVVVMLIAILAMLAAPSFLAAQNEKLLFNYARTFQELIFKARARAAGRGAAHLVLIGPGSNGRAYLRVYEALDGTTVAGPNPVSSCKGDGQWTAAYPYPGVTTTSNTARFVDWIDLNGQGVNQELELTTLFAINTTAQTAMAICITPSGTTYVTGGTDVTAAGNALRDATPFTGIAEITLERRVGGTAVGLKRRIIVTGSAAPRLKTDE